MARKILLADDSVTAQNMGRKILADAGYDVVTVNNGSAALKRITELKPDLIVLDVYMPGYSGLEVCQRLKDSPHTAHIPVLLTVGKLEPFKADEARRVRADAHIVKPFEASELLKAITRLEDRLKPQPSEADSVETGPQRFHPDDSGRKTQVNAAADTGWKSRLGFPAKNKKEESDDAVAGTFREFRKVKSSTSMAEAQKTDFTPAEKATSADAEIPRDITPEELDALSALAAKLDGPIPAKYATPVMHETAQVATHETETITGAVEAQAVSDRETRTEADGFASAAHEPTVVESPVAAVDTVGSVLAEACMAESVAPETHAPEAMVAETSVGAATVDAPEFAVEGKGDIEIAAAEATTENVAVATVSDAAVVAAEVEQAAADVAVPEPVAAESSEIQASETHAEVVAASSEAATINAAPLAEEPACIDREDEPLFTVGAKVVETPEEPPAPSDAELVQALRLLTPSNWQSDASPAESHTSEVAAHDAETDATAGRSHWMAEAVALTPEEAAVSLEAEMFSTFAVASAMMPAMAGRGDTEERRISGFSAITAAVENRLAEVELVRTKAFAEYDGRSAGDHFPDEHDLENHGSGNHDSGNEGSGNSVSTAAETASAEAIGAGTSTAAVEHPNADSGGQECMGEDVKSKAAQSDLQATYETPAVAAIADLAAADVSAAGKPNGHAVDAAPKAMAAAAAEGSTVATATDATLIASIVESVLADLRPKLVEEIARKLAGK